MLPNNRPSLPANSSWSALSGPARPNEKNKVVEFVSPKHRWDGQNPDTNKIADHGGCRPTSSELSGDAIVVDSIPDRRSWPHLRMWP